MTQFNFGKNWSAYSSDVLDESIFKEARQSLIELIGEDQINGSSFFDIGSGSGIFALAARQLGAKKVVGIDISQESVDAALMNVKKFGISDVAFYRQSIFDEIVGHLGKFDVVYSWGVLHHTGDMYKAIQRSMELVGDNGLLVLAIYNKHWSSPLWKMIKFSYNKMPKILQKVYVYIFLGIIFVAKFLVTGKNPLRKKRGMSFYYDVVDWMGGYPYEYATKKEIVGFLEKHNFAVVRAIEAQVPTGCNEFVFKKTI